MIAEVSLLKWLELTRFAAGTEPQFIWQMINNLLDSLDRVSEYLLLISPIKEGVVAIGIVPS